MTDDLITNTCSVLHEMITTPHADLYSKNSCWSRRAFKANADLKMQSMKHRQCLT